MSTLRTWDDGKRCAECCNGDRCDDSSHFDRARCPHCKSTGWALWTKEGREDYAASLLGGNTSDKRAAIVEASRAALTGAQPAPAAPPADSAMARTEHAAVAPQQAVRRPLPQERINELARDLGIRSWPVSVAPNVMRLIRAVEREHGIGKQESRE